MLKREAEEEKEVSILSILPILLATDAAESYNYRLSFLSLAENIAFQERPFISSMARPFFMAFNIIALAKGSLLQPR